MSEGWNGVGVGEAFGATVIRMKGIAACAGGACGGGAQAARPRITKQVASAPKQGSYREAELIGSASKEESNSRARSRIRERPAAGLGRRWRLVPVWW